MEKEKFIDYHVNSSELAHNVGCFTIDYTNEREKQRLRDGEYGRINLRSTTATIGFARRNILKSGSTILAIICLASGVLIADQLANSHKKEVEFNEPIPGVVSKPYPYFYPH